MPRKQKKYHYIYKTTNLLSGKYYIGMHSTSNLEDGYTGSGKRLRYSINKYGRENHAVEILEFVNSREELKKREEEIVNLNEIAKIDCMNLKVGGIGGGFTQEQQLKGAINGGIARAIKMRSDPDFMKEFRENLKKDNKKRWKDPIFRKKILKAMNWTGKKHTQETKDKIGEANSISQKGTNNSQYGSRWITNEKDNKKIKKEDLIPKGWKLGRKI